MPSLQLDGAHFHYLLEGEGPPLVCIAGYACDHTFWLPVGPALREHFQVLTFDNRGVGRTTDDGRPLSADLLADDAVALARALGLERAAVVGQSMGGTAAQRVATRHPEFVERLVLLTTTPRWRRAMLAAFRGFLRIDDPDLLADMMMPWVFGEKIWDQAEALKQYSLANPVPADRPRQFAALEGWDGRQQLSAIRVPTLVGYGVEDVVATPTEARELHAGIAGAELAEFACGHAITTEAPAALAERLLEFLRR